MGARIIINSLGEWEIRIATSIPLALCFNAYVLHSATTEGRTFPSRSVQNARFPSSFAGKRQFLEEKGPGGPA